jgi:hypothetical protein
MARQNSSTTGSMTYIDFRNAGANSFLKQPLLVVEISHHGD